MNDFDSNLAALATALGQNNELSVADRCARFYCALLQVRRRIEHLEEVLLQAAVRAPALKKRGSM